MNHEINLVCLYRKSGYFTCNLIWLEAFHLRNQNCIHLYTKTYATICEYSFTHGSIYIAVSIENELATQINLI